MAALLNAHPFADGNGRASRLLFNYILRQSTEVPYYVPLYELAWLSRGSFVLCVREAEMLGNWAPLCRFLATGLDLVLDASAA